MYTKTLTHGFLDTINAYWRAANYIAVGQTHLHDNSLLINPLVLFDATRMLLGEWRAKLGRNFIYVRLNRVIKKYDFNVSYVRVPGHGGAAVIGSSYLEEMYSEVSQDKAGLKKLVLQSLFLGRDPALSRNRAERD